MPRTTEPEVRATIDSDSDIDVTGMITDAGIIVDRIVTCATAKGITHTVAELSAIEKYLAAHLYALRDPQPMEETTGKARMKYQGVTDMGFESTHWGQTALALDHSGCLEEISKGVTVATGFWLGTERT